MEPDLTDREEEIMRLVAWGMSNEDIGAQLDISARTASTHVSNMMRKLSLANRTQLALYALRTGMASLYTNGSESPVARDPF